MTLTIKKRSEKRYKKRDNSSDQVSPPSLDPNDVELKNVRTCIDYYVQVPELVNFIKMICYLLPELNNLTSAIALLKQMNMKIMDICVILKSLSRIEDLSTYEDYKAGKEIEISISMFSHEQINKFCRSTKHLRDSFVKLKFAVFHCRNIRNTIQAFSHMPTIKEVEQSINDTVDALEMIAFNDTEYMNAKPLMDPKNEDCLKYRSVKKLQSALEHAITPFINTEVKTKDSALWFLQGFRDCIGQHVDGELEEIPCTDNSEVLEYKNNFYDIEAEVNEYINDPIEPILVGNLEMSEIVQPQTDYYRNLAVPELKVPLTIDDTHDMQYGNKTDFITHTVINYNKIKKGDYPDLFLNPKLDNIYDQVIISNIYNMGMIGRLKSSFSGDNEESSDEWIPP